MKSQHFHLKNRHLKNGPTAVVLRFDEQEGASPSIVAQGKGQLANNIIELAKKNNIHMQEDPGLVQNLLDIDLGDSIPPQLYSVIAEILVLLEEMEKGY